MEEPKGEYKHFRINPVPTHFWIGKVKINCETGNIEFEKGYNLNETAKLFWEFIVQYKLKFIQDLLDKQKNEIIGVIKNYNIEKLANELADEYSTDKTDPVPEDIKNDSKKAIKRALEDILKELNKNYYENYKTRIIRRIRRTSNNNNRPRYNYS